MILLQKKQTFSLVSKLHCCFYVRQKVMICQWNIINEGNMCLGLLWWTIWGLRPGQETLLDEQQSVKRYHLNNLTIWEGICCFVSLKINVTAILMMLQKHSLQVQYVIQYPSTAFISRCLLWNIWRKLLQYQCFHRTKLQS